jgi:Protein of unknown function (DUF1553)/Protein of unknown function (DUF1549)
MNDRFATWRPATDSGLNLIEPGVCRKDILTLTANQGEERLASERGTSEDQSIVPLRGAFLMTSLLTALLLLTPADAEPDRPASFVHDVLPVLTKQGCNAAACHGSPSGKGGFRMSLRGYEPALDQLTLLRQAQGRRVSPFRPAESLLLLKPLLLVPHEGGQKLRPGDPSHRILVRWISEGCRTDLDAPACVRLEVTPAEKSLTWPGKDLQLLARAYYADGTSRDVAHLADFKSADETVADVSLQGLVRGRERGETTIVVRYGEQAALCRLTLLRDVPGFAWPATPENNFIDALVFKRLKRLCIPPSPLCTDGEFIRRLYLDVLGVLPAPDEVRLFLADGKPDRRDRLIDKVLERPEYAEYWAHRWGDLLQVKAGKLSRTGAERMHNYLVQAAKTNMPFDRFARALLTSQGSTFTNPPASFFRTAGDGASRAENTAQLFLGARIQCAKCHNHPGDTWTQDGYHGIGAFFARVEQKPGPTPGEVLVSLADKGELTQPLNHKTARPMLPGIGLVALPEGKDRREFFADWLTRSDNPFFAKVAVNRVWGHLLGRGLVEPVDDFRISNPPAHPDLLDQLARDFLRDGCDLKKLTRTILRSRVYQLSSRTVPLNTNDNKYFSHAWARLLPAEVLLDAMSQATGSPELFPGRPAGTRATQLPGPEGEHPFLKTFGQPARETVCSCERSQEPKLAQPLELIGGELMMRKLHSSRGRISRLLDDPEARQKAAGQPSKDGLVLWLDASRGVKGPLVSEWLDQSGGNRHARQPTPQHQPALVAEALGGLPAVRFDGKDDFLNNTTTDLAPSGSPRTILVVGRAGSQGGALFSFRRQSNGKPVFVAQQGAHQGSYYVYTDGINGAGNASLPIQTLDKIREPFVSVHVSAGAGKKLVVRLNGVEQKPAQPGGVGNDEGATGFVVGNREDVGVTMFPWDGDLAEVLVYNRVLTPADLEQAERYLSTRYNLPAKQNAVTSPARDPMREAAENRKLIAELYLTALCREPTAEDWNAALAHLSEIKDRRAGLEDVFWAVLNMKEFLFQH